MSTKYFHEISDADWNAWGEIEGKYLPPPWCGIGGEVVNPMGCWSLVSTRSVRSEKDCEGCDEYQPQEKPE